MLKYIFGVPLFIILLILHREDCEQNIQLISKDELDFKSALKHVGDLPEKLNYSTL